ncbi:hypothetical protein KR093_002963, partial [Drosophila rubida]
REYENRLRAYSQPEKIFAYFASVKTKNSAGKWEIYMTPIDFVRSMMPGMRQPDGLGLNMYRKMSREDSGNLTFKGVPEDTIFYTLRPDGLVPFTEYMYLSLLLPMSDNYFEIGFRIFDRWGGNTISFKDMVCLLEGIKGHATFKPNNSVNRHFFGKHLADRLSLEKFLNFKQQLMHDVLLIEFNLLHRTDKVTRPNKKDGAKVISEQAFSSLLMSYTGMPLSVKLATMQRIREKYRYSEEGVTLDEFMAFFKFVENIPKIDVALTFHFLAGADISRSTLMHITKIVTGVELSSNIVEIIFNVFDVDNKGYLGRSEFLQAMRHQM